jgi:hypothetical protein
VKNRHIWKEVKELSNDTKDIENKFYTDILKATKRRAR